MSTGKQVIKVWIEPGCILCDTCRYVCPEVFQIRGRIVMVRPEAEKAAFVRPLTDRILAAAEQCPADVIRCELAEADVAPATTSSVPVPAGRQIQRRSVLTAAGVGWLALGGSAVVSALAVNRFMFPNVSHDPDPRIQLGPLKRYAGMAEGSVCEEASSRGFCIVRLAERVAAVSLTCTHLGCPTRWFADQRKFKCPCHGSGFSIEGINLEGPAPRPLDRFGLAVEDGIVIVDRSRTYRHERGEWDNPASFISL